MSKKRKIVLWACIGGAVLLLAVLALVLFFGNGGINHTQHHFTEVQTLRAASCSSDGLISHRCSCGKEELEITLAKGHVIDGWTEEKAATCTEEGVMAAVCSSCGQKQTKPLAKTDHNYVLTSEEKAERQIYGCSGCEESFELDGKQYVDLANARHYTDCSENHSIRIYCEEDEAYIREHLIIADTYYYGTQQQVNLPYTVSRGYGYEWIISPETPYTPGNIYVASRSGAVMFSDMTVRDMTFQIYREESKEFALSEDVIFLQEQEEKWGGYYPYALEYSQGGGTYWLTLGSVKGLDVGDIICVGDAKSMEDVLAQTGTPDLFGQITMIRRDEKTKKYLLELTSPDLSEMFSVLDIYSSDVVLADEMQWADPDEITRQMTQIMYQSDDFGRMLCAVQETTATYLSVRGYTTNLTSLADYLGNLEIENADSEWPKFEDGKVSGKVGLKGSLPIDIEANGEKIGELKFFFTVTLSLDSLEFVLNLEKQTIQNGDKEEHYATKAQIGTEQQITTGLSLGVEVTFEWASGDDPYVLNKKTGKYHFKDCARVVDCKDLESMSAETLFEKIGAGEIKEADECKTCQPITSMKQDGYVLNTDAHVMHLPTCSVAPKKDSKHYAVTDTPFYNLKKQGYTLCETCKPTPEKTNSYAAQILKCMQREDMGNSLANYKKLAKQVGNSPEANYLPIVTIPMTITGIEQIVLDLNVYYAFNLEATLQYNYTETINSCFGIYLTNNGFKGYADSAQTDRTSDITLTGKARADVGLDMGIKLTLTGLQKWCYADLSAQVGLYAKLQGAVQYDFVSQKIGYAAAYLEAGLHVNLEGAVRFCQWEVRGSFLPEDWQDLPFLALGYGKVYYNFRQFPDEIFLDTIYYNLERAELLKVRYYDIVDMEIGEDTLNVVGIKNKYTVEYKLKDGTHCTVVDGYLLVTDPEVAFTDELTVVVTGYDKWDKYRPGDSQYNLESAPVILHYEPESNKVQIPEEALEYDGHRYQLYSLPAGTTVEEAMAHCEGVGGYPCTITTPEENAVVEQYLMDQGGKSQIYFGLVFDQEDTQWQWDNGEAFGFTDWGAEAPTEGKAVLSVVNGGYVWLQSGTAEGEVLVLCEWGAYASTENMTEEARLDALVGYYQGWYTATQGITGGSIGVHRTNALLEDTAALQMYADRATACAQNDGNDTVFTAEDIKRIVNKHNGEYIAIYMFGPLRENPDVEDGLYTMTVSYDEEKGTYKLVGDTWIQRNTYVFVDALNLKIVGKNIMADIRGAYMNKGTLTMTKFTPSFES